VSIASPPRSSKTDVPIALRIAPCGAPASAGRRVGALARPHVRGKFLFAGDTKFYVRGVSYGAFRPDASGQEYHDPDVIERDFAQMATNGINTVRIPHTMPPRLLLDAAERHGHRVMVGLSAEQYLGFLIDRKKNVSEIAALIQAKVRECAGHPALLCYALGNEIPAPMARWLGRPKIERYLKQLYQVVKEEDPDGLVSYVNYPTTEYLHLPFLDLVCFNVYLESRARLEAYLGRLQNIAGERPLILSELGLDGLRNGDRAQARSLDWQVRTAFAGGCAGVVVFAWTDQWYRQGHDVEDWAFGLTHTDRSPKPALDAVREAFAEVPFSSQLPWPRISVVVCTYNGARTIRDCLDGLKRLAYPDYEVIVVDDGSTDATAAIVREYDCRLIQTENRGLASARNTGLGAATGEIVAYTDDDAYPDPHWLTYLAATLLSTSHAAVGGPNLPPPGDGPIAECVAQAPGGPVHVLLSDREAEHLPGCNMAFRKTQLEAIGGFDPQFRAAGDDVDVCWKLQERGWTLGFSAAAMVWHHRRNSVRTYWKQQIGYSRAEAMLERKWPAKYNGSGHARWAGRIYGNGRTHALGLRRARVYHGTWGVAPYQSLYEPAPSLLGSLPQMPEWYLMIALLLGLSTLSLVWSPFKLLLPLLAGVVLLPVAQACLSAARASSNDVPRRRADRLRRWLLTTALHLLQPLARLRGRLAHGLVPWLRRGRAGLAPPWPRTLALWSERSQDPDERLRCIERDLRAVGAAVRCGGDYDRWDLEIGGGLLGSARLLVAVEDHGAGRQLLRFRCWPRVSRSGYALTALFAALAGGAAGAGAWPAGTILAAVALALALCMILECASAAAIVARTVGQRGAVLLWVTYVLAGNGGA
jgi:glycosyltransferase involved in cell wall biosynthesis